MTDFFTFLAMNVAWSTGDYESLESIMEGVQ